MAVMGHPFGVGARGLAQWFQTAVLSPGARSAKVGTAFANRTHSTLGFWSTIQRSVDSSRSHRAPGRALMATGLRFENGVGRQGEKLFEPDGEAHIREDPDRFGETPRRIPRQRHLQRRHLLVEHT